jgi:hypothetical protein
VENDAKYDSSIYSHPLRIPIATAYAIKSSLLTKYSQAYDKELLPFQSYSLPFLFPF